MADKELPPLYVKILGDASGFAKTISDVLTAATKAEQAVARSKDAEFEREFTNYMLLQKSKDIGVANAISNINLLQKAQDAKFEKEFNDWVLLQKQEDLAFNKEFNNEVLLEKQREMRKASAEAEFNRDFNNLLLLEKQREMADARQIQNEILLQKIKDKEFSKEFLNEVLLEKQNEIAFAKEFQNELLLEKQRAAAKRAEDAAFAKEFQNELLLEKQRALDDAKEMQREILQQKLKDVEFDKEFNNLLLLDKAKALAFEKDFQNELLLEKQRALSAKAEDAAFAREFNNEVLLEKQREAAKKQADEEFNREFNNLLLLEKAKEKAADSAIANEALLQKIKDLEFDREFNNLLMLEKQDEARFESDFENLRLLEKSKQNSFDREFDNLLLMDKQKELQLLKDIQNEVLLQKIKDKEFDKEFLNELLLQKQRDIANQEYLAMVRYNSRILEDQMRKEEADASKKERNRIRMLKFNSQILADQARADAKAHAEAMRNYLTQLRFNSKVMQDQQDAEEKRIADHEKLVAKMIADVRKYEQEQKKSALRNYLVNLKFNSKVMEDQEKAAKRAADTKIREERRVARERERLAKKSVSFGASGLGSGLTARADIYMHTNAIQSIMRHSKSLVELYSNYTQAKAGLEAFAGSAQKTDDILKDLRDFAQKTPYSLAELTQETKTMMARGMSPDLATESVKRLGAIAGGDINRLSHLALAFSQVNTKSQLMQQELNQLAEQGFNPLRTIAKATKKPLEDIEVRLRELDKAKEAGLITSKHVFDALRLETSAGGDYATLLNKMSGEVGGLASRLREMFDEVKLDAMKLLDEEMKNALKTAIHYVGILKKWIAENKETAKSIVESAVSAGKAILAFHLLGLAVAALRWWVSSAVATIYALRFALLPLVGVMYLLSAATMLASVAMRIFSFGMMLSNAVAASLFITMGGVGLATNTVTVATLRNAVASRLATTATLAWSAAMSVLRLSAIGVQIAFARAWIAFLGPISLAVGAVALVIAVIWNLVDVVLNGLGGSFGRAWESMKMFFANAYGFFMNFGDNIKVLAKYVYENWQTLFFDMLKIVGAFVLALPQNIFTMWKMGMRLTWAFGSWLISYLPTAIYNAFAAGFKFVKTLFSQLLDAGKAVWEFITSPSKWASGAGAVMDFISKLGSDTKSAAENGFVETAKNIIDEERKNLTTGLQGVTLSSPSIKGLKFDVPQEEKQKPPEPEMLPPPEAFTPDFSGIGIGAGAGAGKGGSRYQVQDAISVQSGDYTKKMAAYMDTIRGMKAAATDPNLAAQQKANQLLQRIEKNTAKQGPVIQAVDL